METLKGGRNMKYEIGGKVKIIKEQQKCLSRAATPERHSK